jgi:PAS domain S-box-containing protein
MSANESIKQITKLISALSNGGIDEVEAESESFASDWTDSEELKELQQEVLALTRKHLQAKEFILNLSMGNLDVVAPRGNRLVDPFKELQANLRHLVWQTREIAQGDYSQQIDFLGNFSDSFNSMVNALVEKKKVEESLRESEFFFKESQRVAFIGSYKADFIAGFWKSSEILDQIFGIDKDYCRSIPGWVQIVHPDDQEMMNNYLAEEVIAKRQPFDKEYRIVRQDDGETRWVHGQGEIAFDSEGKTISMIGTIQDITERKRVEEALLMNEERFRSIVENANDIIYTLTLDGIFTYISPNSTEILGHDVQDVVGQSFKNIVHPEDISKCLLSLEQIAVTGEKLSGLEYQIIHRDDTWRWHVSNVSPIFNVEGKITSFLGIARDVTDKKLAEKLLHESQARLETLVQTIPDLIWLKDEDGVYLSCNNMFERLYGAQESEIIGKTDYDFVDRELADFFREHDRKAIQVGVPSSNEEWLTFTDDGHCSLFDTIKTPMFDSNGTLIGVLGIARDITERKKAEEAITLSEARLKRAELASSSGNWELQLDSQIIYASEGAKMVYGLNMDQIDYSLIKTIPLPEYRPLLNAAMKNLLENNIPYDIEFKIRTADTGVIKDIHSLAVFDKEKRIVFGVIQDITERKSIEEAIRESQSKLSIAIKIAHLGSWEYDVLNDLFTFNDPFYAIFRTTAKEVGGYTMSSADYASRFVYPEDISLFGLEIQKANDANFSRQIDHRFLYADGEVGYIAVRYFIVKDEMGKTIKTYGISQDITERIRYEEVLKKSEAELRELNATKDKFFSIISHDLKSPFNSILGLSNLLVEQIQGKNIGGIEEYAGIIQNSSQRAMDLLLNLLEWSRSQTGRMEFAPEYVELVALINEVTELLGESAQQKLITIHQELPRNMLVFIDKAMISTILRNLISNAIKFTRTGGRIVISAELKDAELIIAIRDNGVGIKKENIEKLFRIDESHSTPGTQNEKGTGLGLILCKEFIEKHGGKIWVESVVGKGSTFYFTIRKNNER